MTEQRLREIEERAFKVSLISDKQYGSRVTWRDIAQQFARQDIPDLLAEVRRLKKLLEGE